MYVSLQTALGGGDVSLRRHLVEVEGGQRGGSGAEVGGRKRGGAGGARGMSDRCGALDVALRA